MAHSILTFGDRHTIIHDVDLVSVLCLVIDASAKATRLQPSLEASIHRWQASLLDWRAWAGCIDLDLDSALSTSAAVAEFVSLLDAAGTQLASFGEEIPSTYLNSRLQLQGCLARPSLPARLAWTAIERLRDVVTPR